MRIAGIEITGQIGVGSLLTLVTAIVGFATVYLQGRQNRQHVQRVESKVDEVNSAVNGVGPNEQTIRENVKDIHDQVTSSVHDRRTGDDPTQPFGGTQNK